MTRVREPAIGIILVAAFTQLSCGHRTSEDPGKKSEPQSHCLDWQAPAVIAAHMEIIPMKLAHAAVLALVITTTNPVLAEIDASQADARLIGMPIYTYDGVLIGQVAGVEVISTRRSLVADMATPMGFGFARVRIPLSWANKEEDYIILLMTNEQVIPFLGPGLGIGSR